MKRIQLSSRHNRDWAKHWVTPKDFSQILSEEGEVYKPDGTLLAKLVKNCLPMEDIKRAWEVLGPLHMVTTNRGTAAGVSSQTRLMKNGTISKTTASLPVESFIIGYFDRNPRFPFCRPCAWNQENPEKWGKLVPLFKGISSVFAQSVPDRFAVQKEFVDRTAPAFVIPETVFTTITVNKNFRTACHKDAGDLPQGFGVMVIIREGLFKGGLLTFPDFGVAVKYDTGDILFADVHEWHGNTEIVPLSRDFQRCTLVCYYREKMNLCGTPEQELELAKKFIETRSTMIDAKDHFSE